MKTISTDICVIGAGSGGLSVAAGAVQMGARVVLIEGHEMGGDCLNFGCVPSKALIWAANQTPPLEFAAAKDHVEATIETIAPVDSQDRFEGLGCTVIRDYARFETPKTVIAGDTRIKARRFVIATGSSPFVPPIDGLRDVPFFTNETIFDLRDRPEHLVIIGGGPIGMEMAQAHRRLGCRVSLIEAGDVLANEDPECRAFVRQSLIDDGVEIFEQTKVTRVSGKEGAVEVHSEEHLILGTHLLVAVGRRVNVDKLDLAEGGVEFDPNGVKVDAGLRSVSNRRVYAIGDVAGGMQFTHVAGYHAGVIIRSMLFGLPAKSSHAHIPRATYTHPELAQIGLKESEAREKYGDKLEVVRFGYEHNDRAIATKRTKGFIKVMIVKGRPIGVSIVGADAGEMIGVWALAIANKLKMSAIAGMVLPYPTLGEINKRAAGTYFSPRLFESNMVKTIVRWVQRLLP